MLLIVFYMWSLHFHQWCSCVYNHQFASSLNNLSSRPLDLVLLACNWSTMGDSFFVCHHLAALYAYGYVLVSSSLFKTQSVHIWIAIGDTGLFLYRNVLVSFCLSVCLVIADTWRASLLCQLSSHIRIVHTVCEPKVSQLNKWIIP